MQYFRVHIYIQQASKSALTCQPTSKAIAEDLVQDSPSEKDKEEEAPLPQAKRPCEDDCDMEPAPKKVRSPFSTEEEDIIMQAFGPTKKVSLGNARSFLEEQQRQGKFIGRTSKNIQDKVSNLRKKGKK